MKIHGNVYMILMVVMLFIQQIISGCAAPASKDLYKKDLSKEEWHKKDMDLISRNLFSDKCSLCHELPDIDAYPYTPVQWASIIDIMHDTKAARKFITTEETEKIKVYLGRLSQKRRSDK
jgi:hypothetical protein